ncbi:hypothetical protein TcWFU_000804 [Taenia crassiceps]|uniref:Uncharacterized protein n=1 Tax=Taenia crassiceps TaxID=6207 RepID=A0ABR4PZW2_9CEST
MRQCLLLSANLKNRRKEVRSVHILAQRCKAISHEIPQSPSTSRRLGDPHKEVESVLLAHTLSEGEIEEAPHNLGIGGGAQTGENANACIVHGGLSEQLVEERKKRVTHSTILFDTSSLITT